MADTVLASLRKQAGCMVDEAVILRRERESRAFRAASQAAEAQALQRRLNTLNLSRLALFEKFRDGRMTREEYLTKKEQTNRRAGELSALLEEAESRAAELEAGPPVRPCGDIPELTGEIVDLLVRSIKVYAPDRVEIIWRRRDEFNRGLEWITGS